MFLTARRARAEQQRIDALADTVRRFDHRTRRALYAASNKGVLRRRMWDGCAFNRAAAELGASVTCKADAAATFKVEPQLVTDFIAAWDKLRGSNVRCTTILRDAILAVGLFPESDDRPMAGAGEARHGCP